MFYIYTTRERPIRRKKNGIETYHRLNTKRVIASNVKQ